MPDGIYGRNEVYEDGKGANLNKKVIFIAIQTERTTIICELKQFMKNSRIYRREPKRKVQAIKSIR